MIASVTHVWAQIETTALVTDAQALLNEFWLTLQEQNGAIIFKHRLIELPVHGEPLFTFTPERERRRAPQSVLVLADETTTFAVERPLRIDVTYRLRNNSRITYEHRFEPGIKYRENRA